MSREIIVLDEAEEEFFEAQDWYEAARPGLGVEFRQAVDEAIGRLAEGTSVPTTVPGVSESSGVRRIFVKRFPYSVVFVEHGTELWILAFAHHHRRPGYWRDRKRQKPGSSPGS